MKKIISFVLVLMILLSLATIAFAAKSPSVEAVFVPQVIASYFRVCDADGQTVRYLSVDEITCETVDNIMEYSKIPNLLFVFQFSSTYELKEGEYIEFPIHFNFFDLETELSARMDNEEQTELEIVKIIPNYWMLNITEYGIIVVTIDEKA